MSPHATCSTCGCERSPDVVQGTEGIVRRCKRCRAETPLVCERCQRHVGAVETRTNSVGQTFLRAVCVCGHTRSQWNVQKPDGSRQRREMDRAGRVVLDE